jgi:hypothetical protein
MRYAFAAGCLDDVVGSFLRVDLVAVDSDFTGAPRLCVSQQRVGSVRHVHSPTVLTSSNRRIVQFRHNCPPNDPCFSSHRGTTTGPADTETDSGFRVHDGNMKIVIQYAKVTLYDFH